MSQVYLLQNQCKHFLSKQLEWVDGRSAGSLYKTPHKDEALNQLFEVNAKDYSQRIKLLECCVNEKGIPIINPELLPPLQINTAAQEQLSEHLPAEVTKADEPISEPFVDSPPRNNVNLENATLASEYEGIESPFAEKAID